MTAVPEGIVTGVVIPIANLATAVAVRELVIHHILQIPIVWAVPGITEVRAAAAVTAVPVVPAVAVTEVVRERIITRVLIVRMIILIDTVPEKRDVILTTPVKLSEVSVVLNV